MHVAALSDAGDLSGVPRSRPQGRGRASQCKSGSSAWPLPEDPPPLELQMTSHATSEKEPAAQASKR